MRRWLIGLPALLALISLAGCGPKSDPATEVSATRKVEPVSPPSNVNGANAAPVRNRQAFGEAMRNQAMQGTRGK